LLLLLPHADERPFQHDWPQLLPSQHAQTPTHSACISPDTLLLPLLPLSLLPHADKRSTQGN
jgi:hypothetical protein